MKKRHPVPLLAESPDRWPPALQRLYYSDLSPPALNEASFLKRLPGSEMPGKKRSLTYRWIPAGMAALLFLAAGLAFFYSRESGFLFSKFGRAGHPGVFGDGSSEKAFSARGEGSLLRGGKRIPLNPSGGEAATLQPGDALHFGANEAARLEMGGHALTLAGPALLEVVAPGEMRLHHGELTLQRSSTAGMDLRVRAGLYTYQPVGTEGRLRVGPLFQELQVYEGAFLVEGRSSSVRVEAGYSLRITGTALIHGRLAEPSLFRRTFTEKDLLDRFGAIYEIRLRSGKTLRGALRGGAAYEVHTEKETIILRPEEVGTLQLIRTGNAGDNEGHE